MDFSFAGIKLQSIQCIVQKLHEVKKSSLHSLGMGAHFVLWAVMQFSKYFGGFCFLEHVSPQSYAVHLRDSISFSMHHTDLD